MRRWELLMADPGLDVPGGALLVVCGVVSEVGY